MSLAADASPTFKPALLTRERTVEIVAAAYGVLIVSLMQMPILDLTPAGVIIRYLEIVCGVLIFAFNLSTIAARFTPGEALILSGFCATLLFSTASGLMNGVNPEPGMVLRQMVLSVVIYGVAKLLVTEDGFERYFRWYFYLCIIAAVQAIAATGANIFGLRALHEISLVQASGEGYYLSWWGLLGADTHNFRTNFYFSEASHFAHMLLPAIIYAYVRGRSLSLLILVGGFLTTAAEFAGAALLLMLVVGAFRFRTKAMTVAALAVFGLVVSLAATILILSNILLFRLFLIRDASIDSKVQTLQYTLVQLNDYPFGLGPINLPEYFRESGVNASSGIFTIVANFGYPGVLFLVAIGLFLLYVAFNRREDYRSASASFGILAIMAGTISHGPTFKYYLLFMLSALQSFRLTLAQERLPSTGS